MRDETQCCTSKLISDSWGTGSTILLLSGSRDRLHPPHSSEHAQANDSDQLDEPEWLTEPLYASSHRNHQRDAGDHKCK